MEKKRIYLLDSEFLCWYETCRTEITTQGVEIIALGKSLSEDRVLNFQEIKTIAETIKRNYLKGIRGFLLAGEPLRKASNGIELLHEIKEACPGLQIRILSIPEEAKLLYEGSKISLNQNDPPQGIFYPNGDRLFLMFSRKGCIEYGIAPPIGPGKLRYYQELSDPPEEEEVIRLRNYIAQYLEINFMSWKEFHLLGSGMLLKSASIFMGEKEEFTRQEVEEAFQRVKSLYDLERKKYLPEFTHLSTYLPYFLLLIDHLMDYYRIERFQLQEFNPERGFSAIQ